MAANRYAFTAYQTRLNTRATPLEAVVMLYDGVMSRLARAAQAARARDVEAQYNESLRAAQILNGLCLSLDMQRGAPVAQSLQEMYVALCTAIMSAVGDPAGEECCLRLIEAVRLTRDAWAGIAGLPPSRDAGAPAPII